MRILYPMPFLLISSMYGYLENMSNIQITRSIVNKSAAFGGERSSVFLYGVGFKLAGYSLMCYGVDFYSEQNKALPEASNSPYREGIYPTLFFAASHSLSFLFNYLKEVNDIPISEGNIALISAVDSMVAGNLVVQIASYFDEQVEI